MCDDGSWDATGKIAERFGAEVIRHRQNIGYGGAIRTLFKRAEKLDADVLVTLDSDGQHSPSEIPRLVKPIDEGVAEVVLGSRFLNRQGYVDMPFIRRLGVKIITKLISESRRNGVTDAQSGFRAYNKRAVKQLAMVSENGMSASVELLRLADKGGFKVCEVPISRKYLDNAGSTVSTKNSLRHGVSLLAFIFKTALEGDRKKWQ